MEHESNKSNKNENLYRNITSKNNSSVLGRSGSLLRSARHHPSILLGPTFRIFLALETRVRAPTHVGYDSQIFCTKELVLTSNVVSAHLKVLKVSVAHLKVFGGI